MTHIEARKLEEIKVIPAFPECVVLQDGRGCYTNKDGRIYGLVGHRQWAPLPASCNPLKWDRGIPEACKHPERHQEPNQAQSLPPVTTAAVLASISQSTSLTQAGTSTISATSASSALPIFIEEKLSRLWHYYEGCTLVYEDNGKIIAEDACTPGISIQFTTTDILATINKLDKHHIKTLHIGEHYYTYAAQQSSSSGAIRLQKKSGIHDVGVEVNYDPLKTMFGCICDNTAISSFNAILKGSATGLAQIGDIPQYPQCVVLQDGRGCYTQKDGKTYGLIGHDMWAQLPEGCDPLKWETAVPVACKHPEKHYQVGHAMGQ